MPVHTMTQSLPARRINRNRPWQTILSVAHLTLCIQWALLFGMGGVLFATCSSAADFSENFKGVLTDMPDGSQKLYPDRSKWAFTLAAGIKWPDSFGDGTNWLQSNGECQVYLSPFTHKASSSSVPIKHRYDPFSIADDGLHIRAAALDAVQQNAYQLKPFQRFGSGALVSRVKFQEGRIEIVAKLPAARGSWPAFWLLPADGSWPPEIDIMEGMDWGQHSSQFHSGLIASDAKQNFADWFKLNSDPSKTFHTYSLVWSSSTLSVNFDDQQLWSKQLPQSFNRPMYLIINLAVGGKWVYNELGVRPIDDLSAERLDRGSREILGDYPADLVIHSVKISSPRLSHF